MRLLSEHATLRSDRRGHDLPVCLLYDADSALTLRQYAAAEAPSPDGNEGARLMSLSVELCLWVRKTAYLCGRRAGMTREQSEDCAGDALVRILDLDQSGQLLEHHLTRAWLYRCMDNYAKNAARSVRRRGFRERVLSESESDHLLHAATTDDHEPPEKTVLRRELLREIGTALALLSPTDRQLFRLRCINGEPVAVVAVAVHRTPGAVREAVRALRQRLRTLLARNGFTEVVIAEYLRQIGLPPPGQPIERRPRTE